MIKMADEKDKETIEKETPEPQQESSNKEEAGENKEEKPEFQKKLEEIKAENERLEKNIGQLKELKAMDALGGKSEGKQPEKPDDEVTPEKINKDLDKIGW